MGGGTGNVSKKGKILGASHLILVCLSSSAFPFRRLISYVDKLSQHFEDEILLQTGMAGVKPNNPRSRCVDFIPIEEFDGYCHRSNLVISQAGVGVLISCLSVGVPLIMVPRSSSNNETGTNHQYEMYDIVNRLGVKEQAVVVEDVDELIETSKRLYGLKFPPRPIGDLSSVIFYRVIDSDGGR